jgi:DmsE family decaheme c-type cytochrome
VTCVDCHRGHYNVPYGTPPVSESKNAAAAQKTPMLLAGFNEADAAAKATEIIGKKDLPSLRGSSNHLGAVSPCVCYRCHSDMQVYQRIAGPHQICGPNGFNCTTCHDPHGQIKEYTRKELCLTCHTGVPTMAWHSCIHERYGVSCTDCHNPHPRTCVPQYVNINHTNIVRERRLPMSVQEPEACYKCHPKVFALNQMPSHHPIKEGKMVCSDCHDPHGQLEGNLKAETINLLCYKCHMEKQGPFAYPHQPVTENCTICHEPHGTVANNLLRQPPTFLCLRCHAGHRNNLHSHGGTGVTGNVDSIDLNLSNARPTFYTDCTNCHTQIHGTDVPSSTAGNVNILQR